MLNLALLCFEALEAGRGHFPHHISWFHTIFVVIFLCKHDKHKILALQVHSAQCKKSKIQVAWIDGVYVILIYDFLGMFTSVLLQIQILCEADQLKVAVDDAHLMQYKHRIKDLQHITKLSVSGDVTITSVMPFMI